MKKNLLAIFFFTWFLLFIWTTLQIILWENTKNDKEQINIENNTENTTTNNNTKNIKKVFKVESYELDELTNSYYYSQYWSSVYMWSNIIYTNAHVILDSEDKPIWNYRICKTTDFKSLPECFSMWKLLYYDKKNDLAALEIDFPWISKANKSLISPQIWDIVKVYWYPYNWWETISYTEWKISGFSDWLYKTDANIDAWNSWWWVFNSTWDLIWIAVSLKEWYTTMWYIIPLSKINDFARKKWTIEIYNEEVNKNFTKYFSKLEDAIWKTKFSNNFIEVSNLWKYDFSISDYSIDNDWKYYYLELWDSNAETYISINNISFIWKNDITTDTLYNYLNDRIEETKDSEYLEEYKVFKKKVLWKDCILTLSKSEDEDLVEVKILFENSENNFHSITLSSDTQKNKSFEKWLNLINSCLKFKEPESTTEENNQEYINLEKLSIPKIDNFHIRRNYNWDSLFYSWPEINIINSETTKLKQKNYRNDTMYSYLKNIYSYLKYYYIIENTTIKQNKNKENYTYISWIYNETESGQILEKQKKYLIYTVFLDKIDDKNFYKTILMFTFDDEKSRQIINNLLSSIKTSSWEQPFKLWNIKIWENITEK